MESKNCKYKRIIEIKLWEEKAEQIEMLKFLKTIIFLDEVEKEIADPVLNYFTNEMK